MRGHVHTEEENNWLKDAKKQIEQRGEKWGLKSIRRHNLVQEYEKKFNQKLKDSGMYTWSNVLTQPDKYRYKSRKLRKQDSDYKQRKQHKGVRTLIQSNYIVIVAENVMGFQTEDEVKQFLEQSQILSGIKLFVSKQIEVKYEVKIGE